MSIKLKAKELAAKFVVPADNSNGYVILETPNRPYTSFAWCGAGAVDLDLKGARAELEPMFELVLGEGAMLERGRVVEILKAQIAYAVNERDRLKANVAAKVKEIEDIKSQIAFFESRMDEMTEKETSLSLLIDTILGN